MHRQMEGVILEEKPVPANMTENLTQLQQLLHYQNEFSSPELKLN